MDKKEEKVADNRGDKKVEIKDVNKVEIKDVNKVEIKEEQKDNKAIKKITSTEEVEGKPEIKDGIEKIKYDQMSLIFARFAFVFLIYAIITSGYIQEILSCQMRKYLSSANHSRHLFGITMVFVFIMMEGGWSFNKEVEDLSGNDWSSGPVLHSLLIALAIYIVFIISSKSKLVPNLIFFGSIFALYCMNTQRSYWYVRKMISDKTNATLLTIEKVIFGFSIAVLLYGFVTYVMYQKASYGDKFLWSTFILGTPKCASMS